MFEDLPFEYEHPLQPGAPTRPDLVRQLYRSIPYGSEAPDGSYDPYNPPGL
ncbi:MAG: hypothetical protein V4674_00265 [Patescibacteria group bacterium]